VAAADFAVASGKLQLGTPQCRQCPVFAELLQKIKINKYFGSDDYISRLTNFENEYLILI